MARRLIGVLVCGAALAVLAILALRGMAASQAPSLEAHGRALDAMAAAADAGWRRTAAELARLGVAVANEAPFGTDVRGLTAAQELDTPSPKLAHALALRIDALHERLDGRLATLKQTNPEVESSVVVDLEGNVLAAQSARWQPGGTLPPAEGPDPPAFVLKGLTGVSQSGVWVDRGALWWVTLEPISAVGQGKEALKGPKLVGVLMLEQPLRELPDVLGSGAFLVVDGAPVLGTPPEGVAVSDPPQAAALVAPREAHGNGGMRPLFVDASLIGVWGRAARVPGTDRAWVMATVDVSEPYGQLASQQLGWLTWMVAVWLLVGGMLMLTGWRVGRDVDYLTDFVSTSLQGDKAQRVPEEGLAPATQQLGLLINQLLEVGFAEPAATARGSRPEAVAAPDGAWPEPTPPRSARAPAIRVAPGPVGPAPLGDLLDAVAPAVAGAPPRPVDLAAAYQPDAAADPVPPMPRSPSPATAANVSARDQLMAMLQAKAKPATPAAVASALAAAPFEESAGPPPPVASVPAARAGDARQFREVYEEFVRLRQTCGEAGELPFERFCERLEATRAQVLAQHKGTDVQFTAYVKNGKAALKATPR
jgi:hypothetical protein